MEELQEDALDHQTQDSLASKFRYEAVNGAWFQSVSAKPPLNTKSLALLRLEYILIGCLFGYGTPIDDSKFLNTRIGEPSTAKLIETARNVIRNHSTYIPKP